MEKGSCIGKSYASKTDSNVKVPVIYEMSPYRAGLKDVPVYNVDEELYAYEGNRMELLILVRMEIIMYQEAMQSF